MRAHYPTRTVAALLAAAVLAFPSASGSAQQDSEGVPSVSVVPAESHPKDPNLGQWFILEITQGGQGTSAARITNPADVDQRVRLYLADLTFSENGTPQVNDGTQTDVGLWGAFLNPEMLIPAGETVLAEFAVTVPRDAEPGDHVGVVVAESVPTSLEGVSGDEGAQFEVSRRVATRLYVTVPGDATRAFEIVSIDTSVDSVLFPSSALVTLTMRNEGRVRLSPTVTIGGAVADGPDPFMSQSLEEWSAVVSVPWYGGPVTIPVEAVDESGLTRRVNATKIVIPWGLLIGLVLAGAIGWRIRHWWRNRGSRQAELKADIARLERLITQQPGDGEPTGVPGVEPPVGDEITVLNATIARARRAEDDAALARAALALHAATDDALDVLLEALTEHDGKHVAALVDAVASYGAEAIAENRRTSGLSEDVRERIGARVPVLDDRPAGGPNGKATAPDTQPSAPAAEAPTSANRTATAAAPTRRLADVKGLGRAKHLALLKQFGSVEAIRAADVEQIAAVEGIGPELAQEILDHLR